ncbi:hypothetical protein BST92_07375 [Nonlabens arenilitoris]|uniref:Uncharacterized protein n=1 Tax=Nonlabens arenilitoris TaxID=1217969 RepID=A0A2S7UBG1_9FLAO|nr:hypothetical protein [Nonlabens arenilitoris]PQJ31754.1 hypothetical protein BST92_07375 [Nonlabens arenilitoris]
MRYLLLLVLFISCGQKEEPVPVVEQSLETTFDPAMSRMVLKGDAQQLSTKWDAYQSFITELENFDHSTAAALRLATFIDDMTVSVPEEVASQPVKSRLKVLETRVKSYHALLTHNTYDSKKQQERYDLVIIALDEFKIQMMEVFAQQKSKENLLKT